MCVRACVRACVSHTGSLPSYPRHSDFTFFPSASYAVFSRAEIISINRIEFMAATVFMNDGAGG